MALLMARPVAKEAGQFPVEVLKAEIESEYGQVFAEQAADLGEVGGRLCISSIANLNQHPVHHIVVGHGRDRFHSCIVPGRLVVRLRERYIPEKIQVRQHPCSGKRPFEEGFQVDKDSL